MKKQIEWPEVRSRLSEAGVEALYWLTFVLFMVVVAVLISLVFYFLPWMIWVTFGAIIGVGLYQLGRWLLFGP